MSKTYLTFDDVQIRPQYSEVESRNDVDTRSALTRNHSIETPIIAAPMDTVCGRQMIGVLAQHGAAGALHRFMTVEEQFIELQYIAGAIRATSVPVIASIGATGDYKVRATWSVQAGANMLLIDVAHGDHIHVRNALAWLNGQSWRKDVDIIAGNIATAEGALRLEDWGADAVRVGIGGGSMCTTRVNTGAGVPQISAVEEVASSGIDIPIISDGGIRYPGDVAKAIAAGADTVMIGGLLAGTEETPGDIQTIGNTKLKAFRGSASAKAKLDVSGAAVYVEGASRLVEMKGSAVQVINELMDGLRSAMSYSGAATIAEFHAKAKLIQITTAGLHEAHPHGMR